MDIYFDQMNNCLRFSFNVLEKISYFLKDITINLEDIEDVSLGKPIKSYLSKSFELNINNELIRVGKFSNFGINDFYFYDLNYSRLIKTIKINPNKTLRENNSDNFSLKIYNKFHANKENINITFKLKNKGLRHFIINLSKETAQLLLKVIYFNSRSNRIRNKIKSILKEINAVY